jgi:hypothetical protein
MDIDRTDTSGTGINTTNVDGGVYKVYLIYKTYLYPLQILFVSVIDSIYIRFTYSPGFLYIITREVVNNTDVSTMGVNFIDVNITNMKWICT